MLHLIREHFGPALAVSVAEQFMHPRIREHGDRQRMDVDARYGLHDPKLATAIRQMEQSLEEPLPMTALARRAGASIRQLERLFQTRFGTTPTRFYVRLRLERARTLVLQGARPVREIALECGFGSTSHFCHAYRAAFHTSPTADRQASVGARPA
jgi:AraC family carnitine catabolism transcriptional activator